MTKFSRVALYVLMGAVFTIPSMTPVYAADEMAEDAAEEEKVMSLEESREFVMSGATAKDAVGGTVSTTPAAEPYDIYTRQLAYREHAKDMRASLDQRRKNYEKPHIELLENYRAAQEKIFAAETAAYQEQVDKDNAADKEDGAAMADEDMPKVMDSSDAGNKDMSEEKTASADGDKGLTEKPIPAEPGEEDGPKKKVVTTEDAPDFDPSNL